MTHLALPLKIVLSLSDAPAEHRDEVSGIGKRFGRCAFRGDFRCATLVLLLWNTAPVEQPLHLLSRSFISLTRMLAWKRARSFEGMSCIVAVRAEGIGRVQPVVTLAFEIVSFEIFNEIVQTAIVQLCSLFLACLAVHLTTITHPNPSTQYSLLGYGKKREKKWLWTIIFQMFMWESWTFMFLWVYYNWYVITRKKVWVRPTTYTARTPTFKIWKKNISASSLRACLHISPYLIITITFTIPHCSCQGQKPESLPFSITN